jgi:hypothetical protein
MSIKSFSQWLGESEQAVEQHRAEEPGGYITPTHEELSQLYWFQALVSTLETIGQGARWDTGQLAMSNGTRRLTLLFDNSPLNTRAYNFYPKSGTIMCGASTISRGIPYDSLEAWNAALFIVYTRIVARLLGLYNSARLKAALVKKDGIAITQFFNSINQHLQSHGVNPRPESFLFSLLDHISSPEEAEVMLDLRRLGLL